VQVIPVSWRACDRVANPRCAKPVPTAADHTFPRISCEAILAVVEGLRCDFCPRIGGGWRDAGAMRLRKGKAQARILVSLQESRCAKSVPRRANTARRSVDRVDTNQPLNWAFQDAIAPRETPSTVGIGFTHQRSAVRYRPRPPERRRSPTPLNNPVLACAAIRPASFLRTRVRATGVRRISAAATRQTVPLFSRGP
jgi:Zn-finger nucleic acid-binding protein